MFSLNFVPSLVSGEYVLPFLLLTAGSILLVSSTFLPGKVLFESFVASVVVVTLFFSVIPDVLMNESLLESSFDSELSSEVTVVPSLCLPLVDCFDLSRFDLDLDREGDDAVVGSSSDLELNLRTPRFVVLWSSIWKKICFVVIK